LATNKISQQSLKVTFNDNHAATYINYTTTPLSATNGTHVYQVVVIPSFTSSDVPDYTLSFYAERNITIVDAVTGKKSQKN